MVVSLAACGTNGGQEAEVGSVYWLNFKPEADEALQNIAKTYTEETGVKVKIVTAASGSYSQTLTSEMDKSEPPKVIYYLCVFSMIVPFQMVMFTLSKTADTLKLNTPWTIPVIYLGFGAGLAVFMFTGFIKSIPLEIEEAAAIDGCGPVRTYFSVVFPMLKPTMISVGILEIMWIWNDYLLPYLVLDRNKYMTIPIHIQYLQGSYGAVDLGAIMALIVFSIIPVIVFYLTCQKYIIKGVAAGAVKG